MPSFNVQNAKALTITEGDVKTIHDSNGQLLWGAVGYSTKYEGDTEQISYTGKNKIDYLTAVPATAQTTTTFVTNGFRSVTASSGYATKITMSIKASTTYALSWDLSIEDQCSPFVRVYKGTTTTSGNYVSQNVTSGAGSLSFTTDSDATDINIWFYNGSPAEGTTVWTFIQLEENTSATSYEPYVGGIPSPNPSYPQPISVVSGTQTVTLSDGTNTEDFTVSLGSMELCKIGTYQDYIYKANGNWYKRAEVGKVVMTGGAEETWSYNASNQVFVVSDLVDYYRGGFTPYCDYYKGQEANAYSALNNYCIGFISQQSSRVAIKNTDYTSTANFKSWLSTHNTTAYYVLATATDTQITDTTLIAQLNAIEAWLTRYGYTATVSGALPLIINQMALS